MSAVWESILTFFIETYATTADGIADAIVEIQKRHLERLLNVEYTPEAAAEAAQQRSGGQAMYTTPANINPATGFMWQSLMDQDFLEWPNVPMQELPTVYMDEDGVESYERPEWAKDVGEKVRTTPVAASVSNSTLPKPDTASDPFDLLAEGLQSTPLTSSYPDLDPPVVLGPGPIEWAVRTIWDVGKAANSFMKGIADPTP